MIPMLEDALETVNEAFIQPRLRRFKTRLAMSVVTAAVLALFALLGMVCLFMLAFLSLSNAYTPQTAAGILFGFCVFICLGALLVHKIARHIEDRRDLEARFALPERRSFRPARPRAEPGPSIGETVRDYFAENKGSALIAVAMAGALFGARPGLVLKTVGWALRRKARKLRD
jgi:hypothetical protein